MAYIPPPTNAFAIGSIHGLIELYDVDNFEKRQELVTYQTDNYFIYDIKYLEEKKILIAGTDCGKLKSWCLDYSGRFISH